jgi:maltose O-acetyltransferase
MKIKKNLLSWVMNFPISSDYADANRWKLLRACGVDILRSNVRRPIHLSGDLDTISIGDGCYINYDLRIESNKDGPVKIGAHCSIAPCVIIACDGHNLEFGIGRYDVISKPITIEDKCWIGTGAIILGGVTIGEGAVVAAGAVVNRDVAPYTLVGGVPAKIIKRLTSPT